VKRHLEALQGRIMTAIRPEGIHEDILGNLPAPVDENGLEQQLLAKAGPLSIGNGLTTIAADFEPAQGVDFKTDTGGIGAGRRRRMVGR
jgi:hypothetical protein